MESVSVAVFWLVWGPSCGAKIKHTSSWSTNFELKRRIHCLDNYQIEKRNYSILLQGFSVSALRPFRISILGADPESWIFLVNLFLGERSEAYSHKDMLKWFRFFPVRDIHLGFISFNLKFSAPIARIYPIFVWTLRRVHNLSYSKFSAIFFSASY